MTLVKKIVQRVARASLQARGYDIVPPPPLSPTRPQGNETLILQQRQPQNLKETTKDEQNQEKLAQHQKRTPSPPNNRGNQDNSTEWITKQILSGFEPVFAIYLRTKTLAQTPPSRVTLFHHATSLGGVESLIRWR